MNVETNSIETRSTAISATPEVGLSCRASSWCGSRGRGNQTFGEGRQGGRPSLEGLQTPNRFAFRLSGLTHGDRLPARSTTRTQEGALRSPTEIHPLRVHEITRSTRGSKGGAAKETSILPVPVPVSDAWTLKV